jgi:hypothetical protein
VTAYWCSSRNIQVKGHNPDDCVSCLQVMLRHWKDIAKSDVVEQNKILSRRVQEQRKELARLSPAASPIAKAQPDCVATSEWGCEARRKLGVARGALLDIANGDAGDEQVFDWPEFAASIKRQAKAAFDETAQPGPCAASDSSSVSVGSLCGNCGATWADGAEIDAREALTAKVRRDTIETAEARVRELWAKNDGWCACRDANGLETVCAALKGGAA